MKKSENNKDWLTQTKGIINHYRPNNTIGNQPVRVLNNITLYLFQHSNSNFYSELKKAINGQEINKTIYVSYEKKPITRGPFIEHKTRAICIEETFLSYLWCICHSLYVIYILEVDFPKCNKNAGYVRYKIDQKTIEKAYDLFNYAKSLIKFYSKWDIDKMPNPENYLAQDRDFIEQPNMFYSNALKFILCHEYIHAKKHIDNISNEIETSQYIEYEKQADYEAIEIIMKGIINGRNKYAIQIGITIGILSIFFFEASTVKQKHPNNEDRLVSALEQLNIEDNSPCWGIALVGIKLWSDQFNLNLDFPQNRNEKSAFFELIDKIKKLNS